MAPDPGGQGSNAPDDGIPGPAKAESGAPVRLRLYLSLPSPTSLRAQSRLDAILVGLGDSARKISIETVDLAVNPLRGLKDGIIATPTLMLCGALERVGLGRVRRLEDCDRRVTENEPIRSVGSRHASRKQDPGQGNRRT
jgi:hypothetical protein